MSTRYRTPRPPSPFTFYYYKSQTGCEDPGCNKSYLSLVLLGPGLDPGRTLVGPWRTLDAQTVYLSLVLLGPWLDLGMTLVGPWMHKQYILPWYFWDPGSALAGP